MSRPGFHPDLLTQVQSCSRTPGSCVSTSVLILWVKRCYFSLSHSRNDVFLYNAPQKGPIRSTVIYVRPWGSEEGIIPAPERKVYLEGGISSAPWDCALDKLGGSASPFVSASFTVPGYFPCPKRSDGQCLSPFHSLPQKIPLVTKEMQSLTTDLLNVQLNCVQPSVSALRDLGCHLAGLLGVLACPSLRESSLEGRAIRFAAVSVGSRDALCKRQSFSCP